MKTNSMIYIPCYMPYKEIPETNVFNRISTKKRYVHGKIMCICRVLFSITDDSHSRDSRRTDSEDRRKDKERHRSRSPAPRSKDRSRKEARLSKRDIERQSGRPRDERKW